MADLMDAPTAPMHRARNGCRRVYADGRDAMAYDVGYSRHPLMPSTPVMDGGAAWDGFFDAAKAARDRRNAPHSAMFDGSGFFTRSEA